MKRKARPRSKRAAAGSPAAALSRELGFGLTHLDRVLYPEQGLSKGDLIGYLASVSEWMLPQLAGRPLMLLRCPEGRHKQCFVQKHATEGVPTAVERIEVVEQDGERATGMVVRELPGLIALAQLGTLEIHTWACRADAIERPDQLIFDLDPAPELEWQRVVEAALELRDELAERGLKSFVRATGGKGVHVVAPVARRLSWDDHRSFARALAERIAARSPERYTTRSRKALRHDRVFIDYLRNGRGATAIASYSPRARPGATVATPITWKELQDGARPPDFTVVSVLRRLDRLRADPWQGYGDLRQSIGLAARCGLIRA
jgi:bifunctional non-homologous end joining protein LigD